MAQRCSAASASSGKGLFPASAVERPCSSQVFPSAGSKRMRGTEIKECMTGWADGGYSGLGAIQLRLQITYARERGKTEAL